MTDLEALLDGFARELGAIKARLDAATEADLATVTVVNVGPPITINVDLGGGATMTNVPCTRIYRAKPPVVGEACLLLHTGAIGTIALDAR